MRIAEYSRELTGKNQTGCYRNSQDINTMQVN